MSTEADLKEEIARLTASINQHKTAAQPPVYPSYAPSWRGRGRGGYRGGYNSFTFTAPVRMNNKYIRPGLEGSPTKPQSTTSDDASASTSRSNTLVASGSSPAAAASTGSSGGSAGPSQVASSSVGADGKKEVVIGGVAFESSARSLVRKDLPKPKPSTSKPPSSSFGYARKAGHLVSASRTYKPKTSRGRGRGRNLTLDNTRKSWSERTELKRRKYLNKPCPQFSTTGVCNRGLTCMYQHDPTKIAICWNFLQDHCSNTAETCPLSHDPTPERTPLCVHFLNKGRCTRIGCLFPHVNVGKREGVCRDFAVLGYCEKGFDCDKQHVRECPDFAENGTCSTKGCKLPHVIRANRGRKAAVAAAATASAEPAVGSMIVDASPVGAGPTDSSKEASPIYAEDGKMGDEFISLTFLESEDDEEEEEDDDSEDNEEEEEGEEADSEDHPGDDAGHNGSDIA